MKKSVVILVLIAVVLFTASAFGDDTRVGNTTYHSDGSTSRQMGETTYHSDGSTSRQVGGTTYNSNPKIKTFQWR